MNKQLTLALFCAYAARECGLQNFNLLASFANFNLLARRVNSNPFMPFAIFNLPASFANSNPLAPFTNFNPIAPCGSVYTKRTLKFFRERGLLAKRCFVIPRARLL